MKPKNKPAIVKVKYKPPVVPPRMPLEDVYSLIEQQTARLYK